MPPYEPSISGLEYLLDLNRYSYIYDGGWWWTVRVSRVRVTAGRPFGLKYSLTLTPPWKYANAWL
jgi:hypothetical protein